MNKEQFMDDYKLDTTMFDLENYCDCLKDLLEMFFKPDTWYKAREKYLNREEGKECLNLYLKYIKGGIENE